MPPASADWLSFLALTLLLGVKHGFDADHLATIDGLTRYNALHRRPLARWCGVLFSLGHGGVVVAVAVGAATLSERWPVPEWFALFGALVSIAVLFALGCLNLIALRRAPPDQPVRPVGLKGALFGRLQQTSQPFAIALIGALFALSFDTLSQAALFALAGPQLGGGAAALAATFTLGMLLADGINGLWIARLIRRADRRAIAASRLFSLTVGGLSLLVACFGLARLLSPEIAAWSDGKELLIGLSLIGLVAAAYVVAQIAGGRPTPPAAA